MNKLSLRKQVVVVTSIIIIALVFFNTTITSNNFRDYHIEKLENDMNTQARLIKELLLSKDYKNLNETELQEQIVTMSASIKARITLVNTDGVVIADSDVEDLSSLDNHINRQEIGQAIREYHGVALRYSDTLKTEMLYYAQRIDDYSNSPLGIIRIAIPLSAIDTLLRNQMINIIVLTSLGVVILIALNSILIKRLVNPIETVHNAFNLLASGKSGLVLNIKPSNIETEELINSFNNMSLQISQNIARIENREMELATLIKSMVNGLLFIDAKGYIRLINPAARKLLFYTGTDNAEYVAVIRNSQMIEIVEQAFASRSYSQSEIKLRSKAGENIIQIITTPLYADVHDTVFRGIMILMQDITAIRHIEQTRRDLIANVSHELRTPITSIAGFIETIMNMDDDDDQVDEFLNIIYNETNRLKKLIDDLLELAKIEAGQLTYVLSQVNVEELLTELLKRFKSVSAKKRITIENKVDNPAPIYADMFRVEQILDNIVSNAIKYTPAGGKVTISTQSNDDYLIVNITDTGIGIESSKLQRLTEQFYRADHGRTRSSAGGYGLGLAIVKNLIEAQNGELIINSRLGIGTEVLLKFPLFKKY